MTFDKNCPFVSCMSFILFGLIVQVWNLIAGKMIADFKLHSGPVTSVQFHPRELLMASGSVDKTVKFYDLDRLEVVSESSPESHAVRKVLFHESSAGSAGSAGLLAGTEESLKVCIISQGSL